ncbi:hypothetical protein TcBrA4_0050730 [Trypanosoma cruzi]|nr:hypothetical protein TcBrA4_0050730 [Trypanosoma cruzi]
MVFSRSLFGFVTPDHEGELKKGVDIFNGRYTACTMSCFSSQMRTKLSRTFFFYWQLDVTQNSLQQMTIDVPRDQPQDEELQIRKCEERPISLQDESN